MRIDEVKAIKQSLREKSWRVLEEKGIARFPGAFGRIPNFDGAKEAAQKLNQLKEWKLAQTVKANPDSPQAPVREQALRQGKSVFMAVPRLREERCFVMLEPKSIKGSERVASTIKGAFRFGKLVHPSEMLPVDVVIVGSVAVNLTGGRVGKGGGYSDLEFGLAMQLGLVSEATPTVTTVHPIQIVDEEIPMLPHDVPIDFIITPDGIIETQRVYSKPKGILRYWLDDEKIASVPILRRLRHL